MDMLNGPDPSSLFVAAFALGVCCGVLLGVIVWWQAAKRFDP